MNDADVQSCWFDDHFLLLYLCRRTFCFMVIYLRHFDCFTHQKKRCLICDSKNNCFLTNSKVTLIPFSAILVFFLSDNFQNSWMIWRIISSVAVMLDRIAAGLSYRPSSRITRWSCFRWGTQMRKNRTVLWPIRLPVESHQDFRIVERPRRFKDSKRWTTSQSTKPEPHMLFRGPKWVSIENSTGWQ